MSKTLIFVAAKPSQNGKIISCLTFKISSNNSLTHLFFCMNEVLFSRVLASDKWKLDAPISHSILDFKLVILDFGEIHIVLLFSKFICRNIVSK
jgi:hypothetical protein